MASPPPPRLIRTIGLPGLTAIAVNGVIGSGIFVLPATVAALLGPSSPVAYLLAAVVAALVVACFAEAGSLFDRTGGPYLYARAAFGPFVAFQVGWAFFLSRLAAAAAIANAFASYLAYLWPAAARGAGRALAITVLLAVLAALYVLIQIVALGTLPGLASDPTPLASAARTFLGPAGALAIALGATVSTAGSSSALALVGPRILYALAEGGQLPAALARVHARFRTPHVAIVVFTLLAWTAALLGDFARLAAMSAVARLV